MLIPFVPLMMISFSLFAMDPNPVDQPYDAIINLGGDCQVQYQLRINKLRRNALPFDLLITPFDSLLAMLKEDFAHFFDLDTLILMKDGNEKWIQDICYGTRLIHDLKVEENFKEDKQKYQERYELYQRRITRFLAIVKKSKKILFIRKRITKEQSIRLRDFIKEKYPHLEFVLVVLDGSEEIKHNWNEPLIKNFYLRQKVPYVWSGDDEAWKEIFKQLHISSMESSLPTQD